MPLQLQGPRRHAVAATHLQDVAWVVVVEVRLPKGLHLQLGLMLSLATVKGKPFTKGWSSPYHVVRLRYGMMHLFFLMEGYCWKWDDSATARRDRSPGAWHSAYGWRHMKSFSEQQCIPDVNQINGSRSHHKPDTRKPLHRQWHGSASKPPPLSEQLEKCRQPGYHSQFAYPRLSG